MIAQLVSIVGTHMQIAGINWHVWLLARSPLALGFVGLTRVVPIVLLSLLAGVVADRRDRRWVMAGAQGGMLAVALALGVSTLLGLESLGLIYALSAFGAAFASFDQPARQALIPRLVPPEELPGALSINLTVFHAGMIAGPALSGFLLAGGAHLSAPAPSGSATAAVATGGLAAIYIANAISFLGVLVVLATMRTSGAPPADAPAAGESIRESLAAGLRFVFTTPIMIWTTGLDFFATFFAGAMSLLPIFADEVLGVGPTGYGWLVAAPALGALVASFATATWPLPRRQGWLLLGSVALYGVATVAFGLSRVPALTFVFLAILGVADLISTVIRQHLRQLTTPDAMKGRMTSVNMIFFMGGPQLGELEAGFVASLFSSPGHGAVVSVVIGGIGTVVVVAVVAFATRVVREFRTG